jgi:ATP-dependent Lon protease
VPKDGPSAGIAMATALVSLAGGRPVSDEVAMTGEITLSGQVLAVGGIRQKLLAAHRARIPRVVIPRENEPDLEELPRETREAVTVVLVDSADEALAAALGDSGQRNRRVRPVGERQAARPARTS